MKNLFAALGLAVASSTTVFAQESDEGATESTVILGQLPNIDKAPPPDINLRPAPDTVNIDPQSLAIAREIVNISQPEETREQQLFGIVDQMTVQIYSALNRNDNLRDPELDSIMARHFADHREKVQKIIVSHIPSLFEGHAKALANTHSLQELKDIKAFAMTPSGEAFLQNQHTIISDPDFAEVNQAYMNDVTALLPELRRSLMVDMQEYFLKKSRQTPTTES